MKSYLKLCVHTLIIGLAFIGAICASSRPSEADQRTTLGLYWGELQQVVPGIAVVITPADLDSPRLRFYLDESTVFIVDDAPVPESSLVLGQTVVIDFIRQGRLFIAERVTLVGEDFSPETYRAPRRGRRAQ